MKSILFTRYVDLLANLDIEQIQTTSFLYCRKNKPRKKEDRLYLSTINFFRWTFLELLFTLWFWMFIYLVTNTDERKIHWRPNTLWSDHETIVTTQQHPIELIPCAVMYHQRSFGSLQKTMKRWRRLQRLEAKYMLAPVHCIWRVYQFAIVDSMDNCFSLRLCH